MTKLAIMQPYFLPYIGYFQLIAAVDEFILYDNIKYTKKGWINRNQMLQNGQSVMFSLPLKNDSDYLNICERELAPNFDRSKLIRQLKESYRHAPFFLPTMVLVEKIVAFKNNNLFDYLHHSIIAVCDYLGIATCIKIASRMAIDHSLKKQEKVIALCHAAGANTYINAIGGVDLYSNDAFKASNIDLKFIKTTPFEYAQFSHSFIPCLSIVDLLMFNPVELIREKIVNSYDIIQGSSIQNTLSGHAPA